MLLSGSVIDGEQNIWASSVSAKGLIENKNPPQETRDRIAAPASRRAGSPLLRIGLMYSCKMAARMSGSESALSSVFALPAFSSPVPLDGFLAVIHQSSYSIQFANTRINRPVRWLENYVTTPCLTFSISLWQSLKAGKHD